MEEVKLFRFNEYQQVLNEADKKWAKDIEIEKGRMHDLLGLKPGEQIINVYSDGVKLANDLYNALNKENPDTAKKTASSMLAFRSNIHKDTDIFDIALKSIKNIK